jgi:zinc-ribbon family
MIIFGWRTAVHRIAMLLLLCQVCGNRAAHPLDKLVEKFTLFFIPVFPLSTSYRLTCTACGVSQAIAPSAVPELMAYRIVQPSPGAVATGTTP